MPFYDIISLGDFMWAEVHVEIKNKKLDKPFTYAIPDKYKDKIQVGMRVMVPFGPRTLIGYVTNISDKELNLDYELKPIIKPLDNNPIINKELLELAIYLSNKTLCSLTKVIETILPKALHANHKINLKPKTIDYINLSATKKQIDNYINKYPRRIKQHELLSRLIAEPAILKSDIPANLVKPLLEEKLIKIEHREVYRIKDVSFDDYKKLNLTKDQENVYNQIKLNKEQTYLLHGVTGSGKTEVYLHLIEEVVKAGQSAIVLVPEISLTPQMEARFKGRLGDIVATLHSRMSDGERFDEWRRIERGEVKVVIGPRSAIFAPFKDLGMIIIDEEHVTSFKQENNPRYHALDVALWRSHYHNIPVVLGSANPRLETYARAKKGVYTLLELPHRINKNMPKVEIVDMKDSIKSGFSLLSSELRLAIDEKLNKNEQIILLLNRRGYNTVVSCIDCGYTHKCPKCDITLTYHKSSGMMRCHYCGYADNLIKTCPDCKNQSLRSLGTGTEKITEIVQKDWPSARILRMDQDSTSTKDAHRNIINSFEKGEADILIGTQMIAKGLDFENVTLVGVINADTSLNIPDFRSGERTFELLSQVAGRSGRGKKDGMVIIQTFNPDHYSIKYCINHDYLGFYNTEMKMRKILKYPPFYYLVQVRIMSKDENLVMKEAVNIANYLRKNTSSDNIILGPSACVMAKINNVYRYQILIKYKIDKNLHQTLTDITNQYNSRNDINIEIDYDPVRV